MTIPCSEGGSVGHVVMDLQPIPRDGWPGQDPTIESSPPKWAMSTNSVNTVVENPNFNTPTSTAASNLITLTSAEASDGGSTHGRQRRGSYTLDQPSPVLLDYLRYGHVPSTNLPPRDLGVFSGILSWHGDLQGPSIRLLHCFQNKRYTRTPSGVSQ